MSDEYFSYFCQLIHQHKLPVAGLVGIVIIAAIIGLKFVSFNNTIESLLPGNEEIYRTMHFLREADLSHKVILSLKLKSSKHTLQDLIKAADQLQKNLRPPLITEVISGVSETDMGDEIHSFLKYTPQLIDEQALSNIVQQITPEGVKLSLAKNYRQLLTPAGLFMMPYIRSDPLGIRSPILNSIQKLSASLGYEVTIEDGHFISQDGKHTLLILETPVILTDGFGSRELKTYLDKQLETLPDFIAADIIAGHLHTVSNEDIIKRDVRVMTIIASIAFLLLFLFIFRDIRAIIVFLMPLASVLISINLSFLVLKKLSYLVIGMSAVVDGIAIDYGIYVYTAVRTRGNHPDTIKKVVKPLITGALTTIGIFAAFFFSDVYGYQQLAFFSIFCIVLCFTCALFLLPPFLRKGHNNKILDASLQKSPLHLPIPDKIRVACWAIVIMAAVILSFRLTFNTDIKQFDGSEPTIFQTEQNFHHVWGGQDQPGILVVTGKNWEDTLQSNDLIYREATTAVGKENFSSLAMIWPSKQTRRINAGRWKKFWRQGKEIKLKKLLREYGKKYHFSENAFSPFFEQLYTDLALEHEPKELDFFNKLKNRFVLKKQTGYQALSFFPDNDQVVSALDKLIKGYQGTFLVSQKKLSRALSHSIFKEIIYLGGMAALFILVLTLILLKNIKLTALALVPVITGIMTALGIMPLLGLPLNAVSVIAAMVVVGITSDYGIFVVYNCRYNLNLGTFTAVTLSAFTTLIGASVLLFARHSVLFSIGLTLVTGVSTGYISSILVVPSMYRLWCEEFTLCDD